MLVGSGLELDDGLVCDDRLFAADHVVAAATSLAGIAPT